MSSPISARIASADRRRTPRMLSRRSRTAPKGPDVSAAIRASILSIWRVSLVVRSRCRRSTKRWWSRISPGTAPASSLRLPRRLRFARPASNHRVLLPGDHGVQDRPAGHPHDVRHHRAQLDVRLPSITGAAMTILRVPAAILSRRSWRPKSSHPIKSSPSKSTSTDSSS